MTVSIQTTLVHSSTGNGGCNQFSVLHTGTINYEIRYSYQAKANTAAAAPVLV